MKSFLFLRSGNFKTTFTPVLLAFFLLLIPLVSAVQVERVWYSGNTWNDTTGNFNLTTLSGSPTIVSNGKLESAMKFVKASNQYASTSTTNSFLNGSENDFMITMWFNLTSDAGAGTNNYFYGIGTNDALNATSVGLSSAPPSFLQTRTPANGNNSANINWSIQLNTWRFLAIYYNSSNNYTDVWYGNNTNLTYYYRLNNLVGKANFTIGGQRIVLGNQIGLGAGDDSDITIDDWRLLSFNSTDKVSLTYPTLIWNNGLGTNQSIQNLSSSPSVTRSVTVNAPTNNSIFYVSNHNYFDVNISANNFDGVVNISVYLYNSSNNLLGIFVKNNSNFSILNITNLSVGTYYINATATNGSTTNSSTTTTASIYNSTSGSILTPVGGYNSSTKYLNISWTNATFTPVNVTVTNTTLYLLNDDLTINRSIYNFTNSQSFNSYTYDLYVQNLSVGRYWVRLQQTDINNNTVTTQNRFNMTTNTLLNVTAKTYTGVNINTYSINAYNSLYNYNITVNTTNGFAYIDQIRGLINLSIDAIGYALNNNSLANINVISQNHSYQFTLYETNTINFTFYNQSGNTVMTTNVSFDLIGSISSYTNITTNGTILISLLIPNTYNMRYSAVGFTTRFYVLTVSNRSYQNLDLYLIENGLSSNISIYVVDEVLNPVSNAIVKALKYDLVTNTYILQEIGVTDSSGKSIMTLSKFNEYYKFVVEYPSGTVELTTTPAYITTDSLTLQISFDTPFGEEFFNYESLSGTVGFNTLTNNFNYNYNDATGVGTNYCLYIYERANSTQSLINTSCSTSATGTILIGVDPTAGKSYYALATYFEDGVEKFFGSSSYEFARTLVVDNYGLFLQIIITLAVAGTAIASPSLAAILTPISLLFGRLLNFHQLSYGIIITLTFMGLMIAYLLSQRKN